MERFMAKASSNEQGSVLKVEALKRRSVVPPGTWTVPRKYKIWTGGIDPLSGEAFAAGAM